MVIPSIVVQGFPFPG